MALGTPAIEIRMGKNGCSSACADPGFLHRGEGLSSIAASAPTSPYARFAGTALRALSPVVQPVPDTPSSPRPHVPESSDSGRLCLVVKPVLGPDVRVISPRLRYGG